MHVRTLILGAGVTGLSTAFHLEHQGDTDYLLIEQDAVPGGLCKSEQREGFTFDQSGHLLHLHDPYALQTFKELLGSNLRRLQRRAVIYTQGVQMPFPFQAHLGYLPPTLRKECLEQAQKAPHIPHPATFKEWCLASFGEGIYTHFLRPYNTKLWGTDPAEMTAEWCSQFIPRPNLQQMQAEAREQKGLGYNAYFYYPLKGGCQALTDALASRGRGDRVRRGIPRRGRPRHPSVRRGGHPRIFLSSSCRMPPVPRGRKDRRARQFLRLQQDLLILRFLAPRLCRGAFFSVIHLPYPRTDMI